MWHDLPRSARLTWAEEVALAHLRDAGQVDARNRLAESCIPLALLMAHRVINRDPSLRPFEEDLGGEVMLGQIRAAEKFDPAQGCRFSIYAGWWIKQKTPHWLERE